jgi:hypothetical protein
MKKIFTLLLTCAVGTMSAQVTDTCEIWFNDTVRYLDAKTSAYSGIGINQTNDPFGGGAYGYAGYAQLFEAPDTVTIEGVCFYGVMDSGSSFSAAVKMYDGTSGSPGAMIAGTTHVIPFFGSGYTGAMDDPSILQCAIFPAPVEWEGDYFVGVENFTSSDMYLARNADGDGAGEGVAFTYYKGVSDPTYDGWYQMSTFGASWNFDVIMRPVISYHGESMISYDTTVCLGDTMSVSYQYQLDDSLMYNKFYNPNFASYTGYADAHSFDYGDMSGSTMDTFHLYTGAGNMAITHSVSSSVGAWTSSSFESDCVVNTEVVSVYFDIADQSGCSGDTVYFVANGGYDSYTWNDLSMNDSLMVDTDTMTNGDYAFYVDYMLQGCAASDTMTLSIGDLMVDLGDDTTLCLNENVQLSPGMFDTYSWNTGQTTDTIQIGPFVTAGQEEVVVEVTQGGCSGSDTLVITIDNCLGVEEVAEVDFDAYPNPTNRWLNIQTADQIQSVVMYNLIGEVIYVNETAQTGLIDLSTLKEGVYLLEVNTEFGRGVKKVQIIR